MIIPKALFCVLVLIISCTSNTWAESLTFLGSTGGVIRDIAVYEDIEGEKTYLYVAQGAAIIVYDVTDYQNPVEVNRVFTAPNSIYNLSISGELLVASCGFYSTRIYSLENPVSPLFEKSMGISSRETHLSGPLLYIYHNVISPTGGPSSMCTQSHFVWNIEDFQNPIKIEEYIVCGSNAFYVRPTFLFAADIRVTKPNLFWFHNRALQNVIWNSPYGTGIPPFDVSSGNYDVFPRSMITQEEFNLLGYRNSVAYGDHVIVTGNNSVYAYDPFIIDSTPEMKTVTIPNIDGEAILDQHQLYVPAADVYQVIDLTEPNQLTISHQINKPLFEPSIINKGISYGVDKNMIMMKHFYTGQVEQSIQPVMLDQHSILNQKHLTNAFRSISLEIESHPKEFYNVQQTLNWKNYSFQITSSQHNLFGRSFNYKFLFINDMTDQNNPVPVDVFFLGDELTTGMTLNNNILSIPAGDSGTFHFLLDEALFGTAVNEWLEY